MHGMKLSVCNTDAVCQDPLCTVKGIAENLFDVQECLHLHTHESISHSAFWRNKPLTNLYYGSKWLAAHEKLWQFFIINVDHLLIHDRAQTNGAHCTWSTCAFVLYTEQIGQNNKHSVNISFKRLVAHGALCRYSCGAIASVLYTSFKRYNEYAYIYISKWNSNNHVVFRVYCKRLLASVSLLLLLWLLLHLSICDRILNWFSHFASRYLTHNRMCTNLSESWSICSLRSCMDSLRKQISFSAVINMIDVQEGERLTAFEFLLTRTHSLHINEISVAFGWDQLCFITYHLKIPSPQFFFLLPKNMFHWGK